MSCPLVVCPMSSFDTVWCLSYSLGDFLWHVRSCLYFFRRSCYSHIDLLLVDIPGPGTFPRYRWGVECSVADGRRFHSTILGERLYLVLAIFTTIRSSIIYKPYVTVVHIFMPAYVADPWGRLLKDVIQEGHHSLQCKEGRLGVVPWTSGFIWNKLYIPRYWLGWVFQHFLRAFR